MSKKKQKKAAALQVQTGSSVKEKKAPAKSSGSMTNWLMLLVAILPFVLSGEILDPVHMPRYIFLAVFLLVFIAVFFLFKQNYIPVRSLPLLTKITLGLGVAFGVWSIFCMFNSLNYREGYLDTFRHGLNLVLLSVVMATTMQEEGQWMKLAKTIVITSMLQSLIGIFQYYDLGFTNIPGANEKPFGLMANRNFFGSALVFVMPFVLYVLSKANKTWKYTAGLSLLLLVAGIFLSQTRSAWLSTIVLLLASVILVSIFVPEQRKKWLIGSGVGLVIIAAVVGLLFAADSGGQLKSAITERVEGITGSSNEDDYVAANVSQRLKFWEKTISIIKDNPLMGVGPGNWKLVVQKYVTSDMLLARGTFAPDRPHNVYLQGASETGIPGALLYFGMWGLIAVCGFRVLRNRSFINDRMIVVLMLSGLAAVGTDSFFSFPVDRIEHSLYMVLMGGIILGCYGRIQLQEKPRTSRAPYGVFALAAALILFNIFIGIKNYNFEIHWKMANAYNAENRFYDVLAEADKGKNGIAVMDDSGVPLELFTARAYKETKNFPAALKEIKKGSDYNPNSHRMYSEWGTIYTDLKKYDTAILFYRKAQQLAPKNDIIIKNLAANYFTLRNDSAVVAELSKILPLDNEPQLKAMFNQAKENLSRKDSLK